MQIPLRYICTGYLQSLSHPKYKQIDKCIYRIYTDHTMDIYKTVQECTGFQWDRYNIQKNLEKHNVSPIESEQAFFNRPLIVVQDVQHSQDEERFYALGKTDQGRRLFVAFTIREKLIRVISSRGMNKKERKIYEKGKNEKNP